MTREEANAKLKELHPTWTPVIDEDGDLDVNGYFSASELRAIADILDQVSKEPHDASPMDDRRGGKGSDAVRDPRAFGG